MKPIVLEKDANGNLKLTAEEIKRMVEDAYEAGYKDGKKSVTVINPIPSGTQSYPLQPTWIEPKVGDNITITCKSLPSYF